MVALLAGDRVLATQLLGEMSTNPLTTLASLLLKEEETQARTNARTAADNVVDDNQCRR